MSVHGSSVGGVGPSTVTEETGGMEDPSRFWGDQLESRQGTIRIVYNNSNGLQIKEFLKNKTLQQSQRKHKKYLQDSTTNKKLTGFISLFRNWEANIIALAETQTAWEHHTVRNMVCKEIRTIDRYGGMTGSSSSAATASVVKPGGTATMWDGNWSSRIIEHGQDPHKLGRWTYIIINGRNSSKLCIITLYRCCKGQKTNTAGLNTSYMQQELL